MTNKPSISITIDIKNNRIRLHKFGLHLINDPKHIQILVNPTKRKLAIKPTTKDTPHMQTIKLDNKALPSDNCVEIYSASLCQTLIKEIGITDTNYSYRLNGEFLSKETMLLFSFDTTTKIEN